eukprot:14850478-Heterocapsa_arctica.AAC.1
MWRKGKLVGRPDDLPRLGPPRWGPPRLLRGGRSPEPTMWEPSRPMPRFPSASPGGPIAVWKGNGWRRGSPSGLPFPPWKTGQRKSPRISTGKGSGRSWLR